MKRYLLMLACLSIVLLVRSGVAQAQPFTPADLKGAYGFLLNGFITITQSSGAQATASQSSVGRLELDGLGNGTLTRVTNIGGIFIITQQGNLTYMVNENGTGSINASLTVTNTVGALPAGFPAYPQTTSEFASIVITKSGNEIQVLLTNLVDLSTVTPYAAIDLQGTATRQEKQNQAAFES